MDVADGYTQIRFIRPLNIPGVSVIDPKGGGKTPIIFAFGETRFVCVARIPFAAGLV